MGAPIGNKYAIGNNGGKEPMFETPELLTTEVDGYFEYIKGEGQFVETPYNNKDGEEKTLKDWVWTRQPEPATVTGLALYLGFASRQSLFDYQKKEEYAYIIKKARARVEHEYEKCLFNDKPTGAIFALKNMGWADKTEIDHSGNLNTAMSINIIHPEEED